MHPSSYFIIKQFALTYTSADSNVLEVGSWGAPNQRSAREAFKHCASYVGLDLVNGPGVDLVAESSYHWCESLSKKFDVMFSAQVFEHNPFFWLTLLNMSLCLAPGGVILLVAPSSGNVHRYPLDCWRFYPDASSALAMYCGCDIVETGTLDESTQIGGAKQWKDWFVVLRKPQDYALVDQDSIRILNAHRRIESPVPVTKKNGPILDAVNNLQE